MITIPGQPSASPDDSSQAGTRPSQSALLMAMAQMHQLGRLTGTGPDPNVSPADREAAAKSDMEFVQGLSKMVKPEAFSRAMLGTTPSTNIEDRRTPEGMEEERRGQREMHVGKLYQSSTLGRKGKGR